MDMQITSSVLIFLIGLGFGVLMQRYVFSKGTKVASLEKQVDQLKGQQLQLKDSLHMHFHETADLTQNLTASYKALYEHLAKGASQFTQQPLSDLKQALEQASSDTLAAPKDYADSKFNSTQPTPHQPQDKSDLALEK